MKKILWVCNIMLPAIGQKLSLPYSNREGWLSGIFHRVQDENAPFLLGICFPLSRTEMDRIPEEYLTDEKNVKRFSMENTICYAFEENLDTPEIYDTYMEKVFGIILKDYNPDLMHIFGTEFPHALAAVRTFHNPDRTLVGIQGLCGEIAKVYMADLPEYVQRKVTLRDFLRKDSLKQQQEKFKLRGINEKEVIQKTGNITGRTTFDREGTRKINPSATYYFMNETMRSNFDSGRWNPETCDNHSIFFGQGDYPLKGMHFILEALATLKKKYPDVKLYIAGNSIIRHDTLKEKLKLSAYGKYLLGLIRKYDLDQQVVITGKLDAEEMKKKFLQSSVFVCASVLENSPNTIGEAMLLGMPVVAFATGGVPDMITDGEDGYLVKTGDIIGLADRIDQLWGDFTKEQILTISQKAYERAHRVHDKEANYLRLLKIYQEIGAKESKDNV